MKELLGFKAYEIGPFYFVAPNEAVAWGLYLHQMDDETITRNEEEVHLLPMDKPFLIWTDDKGEPAEPDAPGSKEETAVIREWIHRFLVSHRYCPGLLCADASEF